MSGGGQGGYGGGGQGMGGFGNYANGGYGQKFQPQGYGQQSFGGQSFGGGNPWMRQGGQQPQYGNKMGFQGGQPPAWGSGFGNYGGPSSPSAYEGTRAPQGMQDAINSWGGQTGNKMGFQGYGQQQGFGQPQTGGDFQMQERQPYQVPRNDMRIPPGQGQSFTPPPLGANEGMQVAPPMDSMAKPMALDQAKAGGNIYGPNGGMSPPGAYDAMVRQGDEARAALMQQPAPFGRYMDGNPREDPNGLGPRGQAHQQWYGGGWGR